MAKTTAEYDPIPHVRTLAGAKSALSRLAPPPDASPDQRRAFHEYAAGVYRRVAETDHDHHYEAMAYAYVEREIYDALRVTR
jgi:hypothetical protein